MSDPLMPLIAAATFVGVGLLIIYAGREYDDAIRHTLSVFALVIGLLVLIGVTAKLRSMMGVGRMSHRIEARSQVDPVKPVRTVQIPDPGQRSALAKAIGLGVPRGQAKRQEAE
ncbi:hypothetical protein [Methylobacterium sp. GC_Met_2]|uniref:hypothetical protein n=1 Tax=Methylobacterium sp. GC_Met_2 TaxID=2937376 RepID=UPI00226B77DA|nr:hypothetical protein [Methylobacterium sp. GC_Met_2]